MGTYRTVKPMIVDAVQCNEAKTIATDLGFINVKQGEWVICGQAGETYIVDDAFFQSTFVSVQESSQIPAPNRPDREIRSIRPTTYGVRVWPHVIGTECTRRLAVSAGAIPDSPGSEPRVT